MNDTQDILTIETPDTSFGSMCSTNSDESMVNVLTVDADISPEFKTDENHKLTSKHEKGVYCIIGCQYKRKQGKAVMGRCCLCMVWYHPKCLGEEEDDAESFWTCPTCRRLPEQMEILQDTVSDKFNSIIMKMNDINHLNVKLLSMVEKSLNENKMLKKQMKVFMSNNKCHKCSNVKQVKTGSVNIPEPVSTNVKQTQPVQSAADHIEINKTNVKKPNEGQIVNQTKVMPSINIICDSIPKRIDTGIAGNIVGGSIKIVNEAKSVNDATDYVQDHADKSSINLFHTGTRNLTKDTAGTIIKRFERLEANIKSKNLEFVALSSIVHRLDIHQDSKIININRAIKQICARNRWWFVDNDNIDRSCLWKDGLHLNQHGKQRLVQNVAASLSSFPKVMAQLYP